MFQALSRRCDELISMTTVAEDSVIGQAHSVLAKKVA